MAKKVAGMVKLQVAAGQANPAPPVGPALGQRGINIMEFCKTFNARTQKMEPGVPCPTIITYYQDKSFTIDIKTPPASYFLKKAAGLDSGSQTPGRETVGLRDRPTRFARSPRRKMKDLNTDDVNAAMKIILGSAQGRSVLKSGS